MSFVREATFMCVRMLAEAGACIGPVCVYRWV